MIKILHGADLHLDSPFSSLPREAAAKQRAAQRQLPKRLVQLANERQCDLLLLAGDVFDSDTVYPETVQALCDALAMCRCRVFIAPGNHDPYTEQSVWAKLTLPPHVHVFSAPYECVTLEDLGCRIHGGAFLEHSCYEPIPMVEKQGYLEIGVFHGEIASESLYRGIDKEEIRASNMDYLALGHIHKMSFPRRLGKTWFGWPGVTMGRGFDELGSCGALYVQLDGERCAAEFVAMENPVYMVLTVPPGETPQILPDSERIHCRMRLVGQSAPPDTEKLRSLYAPHYASLEIVDETEPLQDLWEGIGDGTLRGLALEQLRACPDAALSELAAKYLIAALEGREAP